MHYLHLGERQLHYVINQPPTSLTEESPLPFQHWQWEVHRDEPLQALLQQVAEKVDCAPHTPLHVVVNSAATLVPMADFDEAHCPAYLDFVLPQDAEVLTRLDAATSPERTAHSATTKSHRKDFYDVVPASNAVLVFGIDEAICSAIERSWHNVYYVSAQTGLLRRFASRQEAPNERRCFVHLRERTIDVACFEGNRLLGCNTFDAAQTADVVYYACQMATALDCPPATTPFYLCGAAAQCEALAQTLGDFVRHIEVAQTSDEFAHHPLTTIPQLPFELLTHILSV